MIRHRTVVFITCFWMVFTAYAIRYSYGVLLPKMLPSLVISKTEGGIIFSSYFIAYTVFSPVVGLLADRINVRVLFALCLVLLGVGSFLMSYSSSLIEGIFCFVLIGIGASGCWVPVVALVQRWVTEKRRGMTLAFIDMGAPLGGIVSSMTMPMVIAEFNWRMGWRGLGTLALLLSCIVFFLVRSHPVEKPNFKNPEQRRYIHYSIKALYGEILKDIGFWLIGLSYMLIGFSALILLTFLCTYAVQELSLSYESAARLVTIVAAASMVGKLLLGFLSDFLGRLRLMMLCGILISVSILGIGYYKSFVTLSLFAMGFGFGQGAVYPLYATYAADYFSKEFTGSIIGLWTSFLGIGLILAPIIAGWIADITRTLTSSFILAAVAAMMSFFLLLPVRKTAYSCNCGKNH